jgi:hypothetical protein
MANRAAVAEAPVSFIELMQRLSTVKTATAQFTERKYLHVLKTPLVDSGVLAYTAPDSLVKTTLSPNFDRLTVRGDTLSIEHEGKSETLSLAQYPQIEGFVAGMRATLAGDRATLERLYEIHLQGSNDNWQMLLIPRDSKMRDLVRSIMIWGDGIQLQHIVTEQADGDRTEMTIAASSP